MQLTAVELSSQVIGVPPEQSNHIVLLFSHVVDSVPFLKDLYEHITPQYAADWKVIGALLDVPRGEIRAIEAGNPTNTKWCCNSMLESWLELDTGATWRKMFCAIESPAVSNVYNSDYLGLCSLLLLSY